MTNKEIIQLCLDERITKREQLAKQLEEVSESLQKADCEENMYSYLSKHSSSNYLDSFGIRYDNQKETVDNIEIEKKNIEQELKLLEIEIEYFEKQLM